jgi:hypothetical protein
MLARKRPTGKKAGAEEDLMISQCSRRQEGRTGRSGLTSRLYGSSSDEGGPIDGQRILCSLRNRTRTGGKRKTRRRRRPLGPKQSRETWDLGRRTTRKRECRIISKEAWENSKSKRCAGKQGDLRTLSASISCGLFLSIKASEGRRLSETKVSAGVVCAEEGGGEEERGRFKAV